MKKTDVINGFIQAKKRKRKTRAKKSEIFNRTLGSQVLKNHTTISITKLKNSTPKKLTRNLKDSGFNKIISEVNINQTKSEVIISHVIHNKIIGALDYTVNDIILNSKITFLSLLIFFILNVVYYSICAIHNFKYHGTVLFVLFIASVLSSLLTRIISLLIRKK